MAVKGPWASGAFALVSVAPPLETDDGAMEDVRRALGGVAHKPCRARKAEDVLAGAAPSADTDGRAAQAELAGAPGYGYNDFKIELAKRTIVSSFAFAALMRATALLDRLGI